MQIDITKKPPTQHAIDTAANQLDSQITTERKKIKLLWISGTALMGFILAIMAIPTGIPEGKFLTWALVVGAGVYWFMAVRERSGYLARLECDRRALRPVDATHLKRIKYLLDYASRPAYLNQVKAQGRLLTIGEAAQLGDKLQAERDASEAKVLHAQVVGQSPAGALTL